MSTAGKSFKKTLLFITSVVFILLIGASVYIYNNFNKLLSEALIKTFDSNIISDIYTLKFDKLRVDFTGGDIQVFDVSLMPKDTHFQNYPYINSLVRFKTKKLALKNVQMKLLIRENKLKLDSIEIFNPDVQLNLAGDKNIFLPFADSTMVDTTMEKSKKRSILSFLLKKINLADASFNVVNKGKERDLEIEGFNIAVEDVMLDQNSGTNLMTFKNILFSVDTMGGNMKKGAFRHIECKDFSIGIDSLEIRHSIDTSTFSFRQFTAGVNKLAVLTSDSTYLISMDTFKLSYQNKSIRLRNAALKQNISNAEMGRKFKYQHAQLSGTLGTMEVINIDFDSLIYHNVISIDQVLVKDVDINIFKDKTRPFDFKKFPVYLGQKLAALKEPLTINSLKATNVNVYNSEKKPDGQPAKVQVRRINATLENITNQSKFKDLVVKGEAYLDNKIHFNVRIAFNYSKQQFGFDVHFEKFNFKDLDPIISQYTPASIKRGFVDDLRMSGTAFQRYATGTMKFLFHDLEIDLKLKDQEGWKNDVIAFAANTILSKDNPASEDVPARIVHFRVDRDMNKGGINILIKSALTGLKETIIMSKANKKAYKKAKKKAKREKKRE